MVSVLQGKRILITREEKQANDFADKVLQYGGIPVLVPLLKIRCQHNQPNRQLLRNRDSYKWLFFTSTNGVHCFFNLLHEERMDHTCLSESKFAAVGRKTAQALETYGYQADFTPTTYNAETMTNEFFARHSHLEEPVLLIRGNLSRDILPNWFNNQGIRYQTMEVYATGYHDAMKDRLNATLKKHYLDAMTFTSPSSVDAFMTMKDVQLDNAVPVCCIGTTTEKRAAELGLGNLIVPDTFTIDDMLVRLENYFEQKG
ncbi:uroporphyrinogen-III synthase [Lentibacillus salinarum]|uniref:Uroporphyrinogen-III synthase n=1 Tax=Lentibacillus salinarum TaxID=446820 RepID=A0ABW3ZXE4_9BACI